MELFSVIVRGIPCLFQAVSLCEQAKNWGELGKRTKGEEVFVFHWL